MKQPVLSGKPFSVPGCMTLFPARASVGIISMTLAATRVHCNMLPDQNLSPLVWYPEHCREVKDGFDRADLVLSRGLD